MDGRENGKGERGKENLRLEMTEREEVKGTEKESLKNGGNRKRTRRVED